MNKQEEQEIQTLIDKRLLEIIGTAIPRTTGKHRDPDGIAQMILETLARIIQGEPKHESRPPGRVRENP